MFSFPVQLTTCRIGNLTRSIHTLATCVTIQGGCGLLWLVQYVFFFFAISDADGVLHFFYRSLSVEKNSLKTRININRNNDYMYI